MVEYERLLRVARGDDPADLVIRSGTLLNVVTRDSYPATVGICDDTIAYVTDPDDALVTGRRTIDADGMYLAPGLIDSHMHIESTHATPEHFAAAVVPRGITTVAQDPHEMANVLGIDGVRYMIEASQGLPLRVLTFVPTCVPSVPGLETSGAEFTAKEVGELLDHADTIGLAEVMDYWGVIRQSPRITEIVKAGRKRGVILTGHIRGLGGRELNTYLAAGIDSDHEFLSPEGITARARLGMTVEICCTLHRDNIAAAVESWKTHGHLEGVVFVTDDIPPHELVREGHLDRGVRRAICLGMSPVDAVRAATWAPARRLRRPDLGCIAPGRRADLLVVDDIKAFHVHLTIASGEIVAEDGKMLVPPAPKVAPTASMRSSVRLGPTDAHDFSMCSSSAPEVATTVLTQRGRGLETQNLRVEDGRVLWQDHADLAMATVWHRHGHNANRFAILISGSGLQRGALATTYAHDSHNLVVIGRDPDSMALAANTLIASGGGYVAVSDGQVDAMASLPVAGLLSSRPVTALASEFQQFIEAASNLGVDEDPLGLLTSLPLPVVPKYRPTDMGLVDVDKQRIITNQVSID